MATHLNDSINSRPACRMVKSSVNVFKERLVKGLLKNPCTLYFMHCVARHSGSCTSASDVTECGHAMMITTAPIAVTPRLCCVQNFVPAF